MIELVALRGVRELRAKATKLYRLGSAVFKKRITVHRVQECMRRVILKEERIGVSGGVIGEDSPRMPGQSLDQCTAGLADLDNRMRNQEWYHDVSER